MMHRETFERMTMIWMQPILWLQHMVEAHCDFMDQVIMASDTVMARRASIRLVN